MGNNKYNTVTILLLFFNGRRAGDNINCSVSTDASSHSPEDNQSPESPPGLAMAILNATQSLPSSSITSPVVIIRKPYPGLASISGQSGAAPQVQVHPLQLSSAAEDHAAPSAVLVSGSNYVLTESDSSSLAHSSTTSLPVANDKPNNEEAHVPALVEAVVSFFFLISHLKLTLLNSQHFEKREKNLYLHFYIRTQFEMKLN